MGETILSAIDRALDRSDDKDTGFDQIEPEALRNRLRQAYGESRPSSNNQSKDPLAAAVLWLPRHHGLPAFGLKPGKDLVATWLPKQFLTAGLAEIKLWHVALAESAKFAPERAAEEWARQRDTHLASGKMEDAPRESREQIRLRYWTHARAVLHQHIQTRAESINKLQADILDALIPSVRKVLIAQLKSEFATAEKFGINFMPSTAAVSLAHLLVDLCTEQRTPQLVTIQTGFTARTLRRIEAWVSQ